MKILMICGSPRVTGSTSMYILEALKENLENQNEIIIYETSKLEAQNQMQQMISDIQSSDSIVLAFPLYVDGIPSNLLEVLKNIETSKSGKQKEIMVYSIVNNGFYDAVQNSIAIDMIWNWCEKCNMKKGRALGIGAGGMAQTAPLGHGPSVNLGKSLERFVADIMERKTGETIFTEPNFPRFLYQLAAHTGWRQQAKKNGLKVSDIKHL